MNFGKYLLQDFPDRQFVDLIKKALIESNKEQALHLYEKISNHVLAKMGGFKIDGWKLRSPVSY